MLTLRPATLGDLLAHLGQKTTPVSDLQYRLLVAEVLDGAVLAAVCDGAPLALGGRFLLPNRPGTCWFSVVPGAFSRGLPALVLAMRRELRRSIRAYPDGLAAYVADGNREGRRLALALGFKVTDVMWGGLRRWIWAGDGGRTHGQDGQKAVSARG